MATYPFVEEAAASAEVRAVYEDIKATRKVDWINNFWKVIANDPAMLKRTWESVKQIMAPGALDARTKEMVYLAGLHHQRLRLLHRLATPPARARPA